MKHGGKRPGAGMPQGYKKKRLKQPEQLRKTKGVRYTQEEESLIHKAVRLKKYKNFSQYVVEKSVAAAKYDIAEATDNKNLQQTPTSAE